ncbi:hypothetical protein F5148DRAFT_1291165 [Russula earlei]|uniref:Uncharacterized protein n=1 Tax=Russula earlei TaxID=71964 RepID=A0ACC0TW95_9AGAM|nr:hypothetical protein F5148DRAFT_1291165 [Russula earlei]
MSMPIAITPVSSVLPTSALASPLMPSVAPLVTISALPMIVTAAASPLHLPIVTFAVCNSAPTASGPAQPAATAIPALAVLSATPTFISPAPAPSVVSSPSAPVKTLPTLEISALPLASIASAALTLPSAAPVASGLPTNVLALPATSGTAQSATTTMPSASSVASAAMSTPTALSPLSAIAPMSPTAVSPLSIAHSIIASAPSVSIITLPLPPWSHPPPHCHLLPLF